MAKTMNDYVKELFDSIPTPATMIQTQLAQTVESLLRDLQKYGQAELDGACFGSRKMALTIAHRVSTLFSEKGYEVHECYYAASNRKVFWLSITV